MTLSSTGPKITAATFWDQFRAEVLRVAPGGLGGVWTNAMCDVLHGVQRTFGLWCQCRAHSDSRNGRKGERMGIDFTWYANGSDEWIPPLIAIEHENLWDEFSREQDHWKVNQIASPLRVFIGYTRHAKEVGSAAQKLMSHEHKWHPIAAGEALVILGHGGMTTDFRAWATRQGQQAWKELPA